MSFLRPMLWLGAVILSAPITASQIGSPAGGASVKVEFENPQIRIVRVRTGPHETSALSWSRQRAVVAVTDQHIRQRDGSGAANERWMKAGEFDWFAAGGESLENLSDSVAESVTIEFKNAQAPSVSVDPPPGNASPLTPPVAVQQEPHHHWIFENQYVRVLDVVLPPGETTLFHTHSHDNVALRAGDARIEKQDWGKGWDRPSPVVRGEVTFTLGAKQPYTHRLKNVGSTPFHVIDIELLQ
jgi:hypothetical protein